MIGVVVREGWVPKWGWCARGRTALRRPRPSHAITPIRAGSRIFPMRKARRVFHSVILLTKKTLCYNHDMDRNCLIIDHSLLAATVYEGNDE